MFLFSAPQNFSFLITVIAIGFFTAITLALAVWTPPPFPPDCLAGSPGCDPPLNTGPEEQTRIGDLWLSGFSTFFSVGPSGGPFGGNLIAQGGLLAGASSGIPLYTCPNLPPAEACPNDDFIFTPCIGQTTIESECQVKRFGGIAQADSGKQFARIRRFLPGPPPPPPPCITVTRACTPLSPKLRVDGDAVLGGTVRASVGNIIRQCPIPAKPCNTAIPDCNGQLTQLSFCYGYQPGGCINMALFTCPIIGRTISP